MGIFQKNGAGKGEDKTLILKAKWDFSCYTSALYMHYTLHYIHDIYNTYISCIVVQSLSHVQLFMTPWTEANQPSQSPWICSNSCPLCWWYYLTISSSAAIFSFCFQSFPTPVFSNESALRIRWPKYWSFSFSISPSNVYSGLISFRIAGLISQLPKGLPRVFSQTTIQKHQFFGTQPFLWSNCHIYTWLYGPLSAKWCLWFLMHRLGLS